LNVKIPAPKGIKPRDKDQSPPMGGEEAVSLRCDTAQTPPLSVTSLLLTLISALVMGLFGLTAASIPDIYTALTTQADWNQPLSFEPMVYTLQLPFALLVGALLGGTSGILCVLLYLGLGLFFLPIFSNGGGFQYLSEPGFGYFLGMAAGTYLCGKLMTWVYRDEDPIKGWGRMLACAVAGVLTVHLVGILGMALLLATGKLYVYEMGHWLVHLSAAPLPYDLLIGVALLWLVRPIRYLLWLVLY
jgi:biotin transport system substrate-specific component